MKERFFEDAEKNCTVYLLEKDPANFETAIKAAGYGRFNIYVLLCSFPVFWSAVSVPSAQSYILASAHCHLRMNFMEMGLVNAIAYVGMIASGIIWGFLSDTLGRRHIIGWGFILTGIVEVISACSQTFIMLLSTRFVSGFFFNGPFAAVVSYLAEVHRTEHRARVLLFTNLFYTIAQIILPLIAYALLFHSFQFRMFSNLYLLHSWNLFLMTSSVMPIFAGILFLCLPESPRFLMSRRRNQEALEVFRKIYAMNTRRKPMDYPIQTLETEAMEKRPSGFAALRAGFCQLLPLYKPPFGPWLLIISFLHLGSMFGSNTLRLWYPFLAVVLEYSGENTVCKAMSAFATYGRENTCNEMATEIMSYVQSSIIGAGSFFSYLIGGFLVNACGKKNLLVFSGLLSALLVAVLPHFGTNDISIVLLVTFILALTSLFGATLSSVVADLFSTTWRVSAMATFMMHGKMGTVAGLMIFPALVQYGCYPPFIVISVILSVCGYVSLLLPETALKKLR